MRSTVREERIESGNKTQGSGEKSERTHRPSESSAPTPESGWERSLFKSKCVPGHPSGDMLVEEKTSLIFRERLRF